LQTHGKSNKKIRVLIVDDSAFYRQVLSTMVASMPHLEVVGTARDGADAIMMVTKCQPDVITVDLEMPKVDGFVFLRWLMKNSPLPVIVVSSQSDQANVFKALELGAVDFLAKPTPQASWKILDVQEELISKIIAVSTIPIERLVTRVIVQDEISSMAPQWNPPHSKSEIIQIVAIGASTGGPTAVQSIVSHLPGNFPVPVVVSQHMPPGFTQYFSERLNKLAHVGVQEARHGNLLARGQVYICPGGYHMVFRRTQEGIRIQLDQKQDSDRYVPSVDRMFLSVCEVYQSRVLGVVLTGMGNDGKVGIRKIKENGGQTIAESEETAVVFGMPKEAISEGVVDQILPLPQICKEIIKAVSV
jgi:two-component system chemotaxis response regulator CheB